MKNFLEYIEEAVQPSFPEDDFTEYKYNILIPDSYVAFVKKWLYEQSTKASDYFVKEAIEDILRGLEKSLSYKAGINFTYKKKIYSVYSYGKIFFFSSPYRIKLKDIVKMIGAN